MNIYIYIVFFFSFPVFFPSALQTKTFFFFFFFFFFANSLDPDEMDHNEPSHQDVHGLTFCFGF